MLHVYPFSMRKRLAIFALLVVTLPTYGQVKGPQSVKGQNNGAGTHVLSEASKAAVCAVDQNVTVIECSWPQAGHKSYFSRLFAAENLPNLLLVAVGLGAIAAAIKTLWAIQRQAELMERQTKLTEASMKQWVELDKWKSEIAPNSQDGLTISFQVSNPTNFLLIVGSGRLKFDIEPGAEILFIYREAPLAPNRPLTIEVPLRLNPRRMNTFKTGTMGLGVEGTIIFLSALDTLITQEFKGVLSCSLTETKFEAVVRMRQTHTDSAEKY